MKRGGVIAVAGKGGTGKTAISALLIRELKESADGDGDDICILAVDADADSNLPDALGISYNKSVGDIREELLEEKQQDVALDLRAEFEGKIAEIIEEEEYFDLLVMGRPEGPGCYCPVNHILRMVIDTLARNYDYTVIDCEAGLEHLSRRTTRDVDVMIAVLDTTLKSIKTALRLKEIAAEIDVDVQRIFTIANKIPAGAEGRVRAEAEKYGIEIEDIIPFDRLVEEYDFSGKPIIDLPDSAPSVIGVKRIAMRIINNQQAV
ncbi:MAG: AAA family ATPase [Methanophagales archaeon]|nr:AAA family ATPase [Methanophagales archaeon]MCW3138489.1 AAA family ATPase [Methanophagales archaeon]MCW3140251.1 AAA family ATPase [Methanophagales archaeon]MCW7070230.1 AAA family ATPase [Methanophagales archaeon]